MSGPSGFCAVGAAGREERSLGLRGVRPGRVEEGVSGNLDDRRGVAFIASRVRVSARGEAPGWGEDGRWEWRENKY